MEYQFFNEDCISGSKRHLGDNSVDLIIADPPYGISGDKLDRHYNRNEGVVLDGYVEVPQGEYASFSKDWIKEAERVLKPGGSMYIISGYTNLRHILNALAETDLQEINHIIWKYNFGVFTRTKYISSHYHILYFKKGKSKHRFNTFCRFSDSEKGVEGGSANYQDREDVWQIKREYAAGAIKNKNTLPTELLIKIMQYSSTAGDVVCDFFLGSFSTAKVAKGLNRHAIGFEVNKTAFDYQLEAFEELDEGYLADTIRTPPENTYTNQGKKLTPAMRQDILSRYGLLIDEGHTKKRAIETLCVEFGRGYWSLLRVIDGTANQSCDKSPPPQI